MVVGLLGAVVGLAYVTRDPVWCVAGVLGLTLVGAYRVGIVLGVIDLRLSDLPLALLMAWVVHRRIQDGRVVRADVGQRVVAVLLMIFGLSLVASYGLAEGDAIDLVVSLARLVATFSLVWLVPYAVRTARHRLLVIRALVVTGGLELAWTAFVFLRDGRFPDRLRGVNGPNAEGLVAALILIAVINLPVFRPRVRFAIGVLAGACLLQTKSIGSIAAFMMVVGLFGFRVAHARNPRTEALLRPARLLVIVAGVVLLVSNIRPQDLPNQEFFEKSSTASRIALGYTGLLIFADHPVLGVGWQRSSSREVIGDAALVEAVRERFPNISAGLRPGDDRETTVHNAYIQILAESGVIGGMVLVAALILGRKGARRVVARSGPEAPVARTVAAMLVLVLIWWNDNPLFGAQPETVVFAVLLGLLASIPLLPEPPRVGRRRSEVPVSTTGG